VLRRLLRESEASIHNVERARQHRQNPNPNRTTKEESAAGVTGAAGVTNIAGAGRTARSHSENSQ
jgi:hypothetical protein